ncbi:MAG: InlB B-repeat-containing protein [Clostridiales bacterium]|nr:InlB B-repeat-containing protein [Clostridiales bacterium]
MNKLYKQAYRTLGIIVILIIISIIFIFTLNRQHAQAQEYDASPLNQAAILSSSKNDTYEKMSDINSEDLTSVKYISNSAYFIANPKHARQNSEYNSTGTCTTVAMQMLLGYHNYYSDRRLIPEFGENNRQFLSDDYGKITDNPILVPSTALDYGRSSIGTETGVYDEIYDLTTGGSFPGLGQAVGPVTRAAQDFVEKYSIIYDNVNIKSSWFSDEEAKAEINANRPIILGMSWFNGAENYHVMVAYGYATVKGVPGYIVHCGWNDDYAYVWAPTEYFEYQIRMNVHHTHNLVDTGINIKGAYQSINYRQLECTTCRYTTIDDLYDTNEYGTTITGTRYPVSGELQIPLKIHNKTITAIGNGAFSGSQITALDLQHYISIIGDSAFENCYQLAHISSFDWVAYIGKYAFRKCNLQMDIEIPTRLTKIEEGAFAGCDSANISVSESNQVYYTENNILYNKSKTTILQTLNITNRIIIPDSIQEIAPYAFESNSNIDTVRFSGNPEIGNNSFANCANLGNVYFDTYSSPIVGVDVFKNKVPTIIVPYNAQNDFKQAFNQYSDYITSQQFAVDFISNGQVIESRSVYSGSTIENLPTPTLTGYDFGGWYDNPDYTGTPYANGNLWESNQTITLYAKWISRDCTIFFDGYGGIVSGTNPITVKYGEPFSTNITANKTGNVLDGWYDSNNILCITADGRSTKPWDRLDNTTLQAKWSPKSYEIQINDDGSIVWLSNKGFSNEKCYIQYGTVLSSINLIAIFKQSGQGFKEGKIFDHFEYNDSTLDWTSVPDLGENNSVITIVPIWINEVHTIYFETLCDTVENPIVGAFGSSVKLPTPSRTGHAFSGWYTTKTGGTRATWTTMPDLTPTEQNNGSTQLIARWTPITYRVYYNANGGRGTMNFTSHTYGVAFTIPKNIFTKTGHDFIGWATSPSGQVVYSNSQVVQDLAKEQSESVNLYAVWKAKTYTITYKNLTSDMFATADNYYTYGVGMPIMPTLRYKALYGPYPPVKDFYGWFTSNSFTTPVNSIDEKSTGDITLYAKYDYFVTAVGYVATVTVTDAGTSKNCKIDVPIDLKSKLYEKIQNTTLTYMRVDLSFYLWEIDDGYQHIYLRNDADGSTLWSTKIDHSGGKTKYTYTFKIELTKVINTDSITFLFDASGAWSDDWQFSNFDAYVYLTN